ncbi:unnamed protein product [Penicillium roqueforti FM164]|uniref:Genomic scaffold, ProqFM164S02 n=1 Tax=Penicillium roqueforti (strain FM164) TaxID=1365484 RepID=W6Q746_PENRF|nr:unnamed protein product [Penicillium roqueforti FM164]
MTKSRGHSFEGWLPNGESCETGRGHSWHGQRVYSFV